MHSTSRTTHVQVSGKRRFTAVIGKHAVFGRRAFGRPEHLYDMATNRPVSQSAFRIIVTSDCVVNKSLVLAHPYPSPALLMMCSRVMKGAGGPLVSPFLSVPGVVDGNAS